MRTFSFILAGLAAFVLVENTDAASKKSRSKAAPKIKSTAVAECKNHDRGEGWQAINEDAHFRIGCARVGDREHEFVTLAFHMSKHDMRLVGSSETGDIPSLKQISNAQTDQSAAYSVRSPVLQEDKRLLIASIGYPQSDELFDLAGFARIGGKEVSDRDDIAEFKSAFLCLNEVKKNDTGGSRTVVFNAFERGLPVTMNERAADVENCPDLIQVGPRIVEYRSDRGIAKGSQPQNWLVFSQGNGPKFYGYVTFMKTPADLYDIQEILLSEGFLGVFDKQARVAVALTSGRHSSLTLNTKSPDSPQRFGQTNKNHPVFLTVTPSQ